jgi:MFS family permease
VVRAAGPLCRKYQGTLAGTLAGKGVALVCILISLVPATAWLVISYVVFFLADRSEGRRKALGRALGLWAIGIAICILAFGAIIEFIGDSSIKSKINKLLDQPRATKTIYDGQEPGKPGRSY